MISHYKKTTLALGLSLLLTVVGLVYASSASAQCDQSRCSNNLTTVPEGDSVPGDACKWDECGQCPQGHDACTNFGEYRCVIGHTNNWVARCDVYSNSCTEGYWHAVGWIGDALYNQYCNGTALTPTPYSGGGGPTPTGGVPTPVGNQCQNGEQNRDQDTWLICECANGCNYREDNTPGGGGGGWVCEENCRTVPIGTRPSGTCTQIDYVHEGTSDYCGVAEINCPSSCQTTTTTPTPGTNNTPTPGTNSTPTPTPPVTGPTCNNIELLDANSTPITGSGDASLRPGDAIKLRCGASAAVDHYEFRITRPDATTVSIAHVGNSAISSNYVLTASGSHTAQCRICTGASSCQEWETVAAPPGGSWSSWEENAALNNVGSGDFQAWNIYVHPDTNNITQHLIRGGKLHWRSRDASTKAWSSWEENAALNNVGSGDFQAWNIYTHPDTNKITQHLIRGNKLYGRDKDATTDTWSQWNENSALNSVGSGDFQAWNVYVHPDTNNITQHLIRGGKLYWRNKDATTKSWSSWEENAALNNVGSGDFQAWNIYVHPDTNKITQHLIRGGKLHWRSRTPL